MKKWGVLFATTMALLLVALGPVAAFAQSGQEAGAGDSPAWRGALAIVAPLIVPVGREMSLRVFLRQDQEPFPGAGVWAVTRDDAEGLKKAIADLAETSGPSAEGPDYEALVNARGSFLGRTGEDGRLRHTFTDAGNYLLVAARRGYFPGFSPITVRAVLRALVIQAPGRAPVGEAVTMTVFLRGTEEPVGDAGIWALTREDAEALSQRIAELRAGTSAPVQETDWESVVGASAIFLGRTHGNGELKYTFTEEGLYLLLAIKKGYIPGRAGIAIRDVPQALAIQVPRRAPVGESVTITVVRKGTEDPVKDAGVWALTRESAEALRGKIAELREQNSAAVLETDWESLAGAYGIFLGTTHGNGQLKYTFTEAGNYLLVAVKKGYVPGYAGIAIVAPVTVERPAGPASERA